LAKQDKLSKAAAERIKNYEVKTIAENDTRTTRRRDNRNSILISVVAVVVAVAAQFTYFSAGPGSVTASPSQSPSTQPSPSGTANAPEASIAENREWTGSMTLNETKMNFIVDGKNAPKAAANFISLVKSGFYEGITCHRLTTA
jgi:peptidyl-prolyl cis-trans isomerase B (cyclophilin B)